MLVYRIVAHRYSHDLNGTGAGLYGGRWNPVGTPLLYTSQHRSLALCEMMVNLDEIQLKQDYDLITINVPDKLALKKLSLKRLPDQWNQRMISVLTQEIGEKFVQQGKYLGLEVPSVVIPEEYNLLLNPMHEDFDKIKVIERKQFIFDKRLF